MLIKLTTHLLYNFYIWHLNHFLRIISNCRNLTSIMKVTRKNYRICFLDNFPFLSKHLIMNKNWNFNNKMLFVFENLAHLLKTNSDISDRKIILGFLFYDMWQLYHFLWLDSGKLEEDVNQFGYLVTYESYLLASSNWYLIKFWNYFLSCKLFFFDHFENV